MFSIFRRDKKKIETLEKKVESLEAQILAMKKLLLQASTEVSNIDTILRVTVAAQSQLSNDVHEIFSAIQKAVKPEDYYGDKILKSVWSDDDDDGGLLN